MQNALGNSQVNFTATPFLRWAGGKSWLIKYLSKIKDLDFNNYYEPFLGGGAVYFHLFAQKKSFLSDLNGDLIETYQAVKEDVNAVVKILSNFQNNEESYYKVRKTLYNDRFDKAAQFIYLNQTSYNGIYRVNLKGEYNVPYGFRAKTFIEKDVLQNAHMALTNTTLYKGDFYEIMNNVKEKDLIFLDPPYTVAHNNNGFIKYNEKIFSLEDQYRLSNMIDELKYRGAYYILTNAAHDTIKEIFEKGDYRIERSRGNTIGGAKASRGQTEELIFTNIAL